MSCHSHGPLVAFNCILIGTDVTQLSVWQPLINWYLINKQVRPVWQTCQVSFSTVLLQKTNQADFVRDRPRINERSPGKNSSGKVHHITPPISEEQVWYLKSENLEKGQKNIINRFFYLWDFLN